MQETTSTPISAADYTPARRTTIVQRAVGFPDFPVEIEHVAAWELAALLAKRYKQGRVLLAGDDEADPTSR